MSLDFGGMKIQLYEANQGPKIAYRRLSLGTNLKGRWRKPSGMSLGTSLGLMIPMEGRQTDE
jgi:hypothetical protein